MTQIEVAIGWTRSDMERGYSSFDGYRPGASQHTETILVDMTGTNIPVEKWPELIAEACWHATNAPRLVYPQGLVGQVCRLIDETGYHGEGAHYTLSVGDTVTLGEITLACAPLGWERVSMASA